MLLYKPLLFRLANQNRCWLPLVVVNLKWSKHNLYLFEDGDDFDPSEEQKDENTKETEEKKDDKNDSDSSDDEDSGGRMIPVIEIIKGIFPRIFRPSAE